MWMLYSQIGVLGLLFVLFALTYLTSKRAARCWGTPFRRHHTANKRAEALLHEVLQEVECQQVRSCGFLDVPSPSIDSRVYRIPSIGGLVTIYEDGRPILGLCLQPTEPLPLADVVVLHKLLIETNEEEYFQQANHFTPQVIGTPETSPQLPFLVHTVTSADL